MMVNNTRHATHVTVTYFQCISIEYFIQFMISWNVEECFFDVGFNILVIRWIEPYNIVSSVPVVCDFCFGICHCCFILTFI